MNRLVAIGCVLIVGFTTWVTGEETAQRKGEFLTPAEFAELGEKSKVHYGSKVVKSSADWPAYQPPWLPKNGPAEETPYPVISRGADGSRSLSSFQLLPVAKKALSEAEPLFQAKEYRLALPIYLEAVDKDPKCYVLYLSIGDCYLFSGNPVAALENRTDRDGEAKAKEPQLDLLLEVLDAGQLAAFLNYQFGSQVARDYPILLDDESQEKMTQFVEQYVFEKE